MAVAGEMRLGGLADGFVEFVAGFGSGDFFEEVDCVFLGGCFDFYATVGAYGYAVFSIIVFRTHPYHSPIHLRVIQLLITAAFNHYG